MSEGTQQQPDLNRGLANGSAVTPADGAAELRADGGATSQGRVARGFAAEAAAADPWDYTLLKAIVRHEELPLMLVDLDVVDENVRRIAQAVSERGKTLRMATKSVRVPALLKHIYKVGGSAMKGLMCFNAAEAEFLSTQGFDDLLIAYPTVQRVDLERLWRMTQDGKSVTAMIDEPGHVEVLANYWKAKAAAGEVSPLRVCVDVDVSLRTAGRHIGVQRSPVRHDGDFERLLNCIEAATSLHLVGVMAYEAQIAGVADAAPAQGLRGPITRLMKARSVRYVAARRARVAAALKRRGIELEFFNGGGTGSVATTSGEECVSEVTAGSGFLQSHLFDYYAANRAKPAMCFALPITRIPQRGIVTCQSGGFVASGGISALKAPVVFRPGGLRTIAAEGYGEVQTPLVVPSHWQGSLLPGDPVFFRPAKAGEIAERFNEYLLKRADRIVGRAKSYRGLGLNFF